MTATPTLSPAKPDLRFALVPPTHIAPRAAQVRRHFDEAALAELTDSVREHGIIEPIIVRSAREGDSTLPEAEYTLFAGERRWRAAIAADLAAVPCVIRDDLSDGDLEVLQVLENLQRADLTLPEVSAGVAKLVDTLGPKKTAAQLGKSEGWVSKHASVRKLPENVRELVESGAISSVDIAQDLAQAAKQIASTTSCNHHVTWAKQRLNGTLAIARDGGILTRESVRNALSDIKRNLTDAKARDEDLARRNASAASSQPSLKTPEQQAREENEALAREAAEALAAEARDLRHQREGQYRRLEAASAHCTEQWTKELYEALGITLEHDEDGDLITPGPSIIIDCEAVWVQASLAAIETAKRNPIPEAPEQALYELTLPKLHSDQVRAVITALAAHRTQTILAGMQSALAPTQEPPEALAEQFARWISLHSTRTPGSRVQCVDLHQRFNATLTERIPLTSNRWSDLAAHAGLTKKRLKTGYVYLDVQLDEVAP